jgi:cytochrome P450
MWNNNRILRTFLLPHIERGATDYKSRASAGPKTINSLAIKSYVSEVQSADPSRFDKAHLDPAFIEVAISQLKMFLVAGHDTTASTLSFAYHLLHTHPATLATLRAEHDAVLGPNAITALDHIAANPKLLNQLPYTAAVIKETLRLYPPVGSIRQGPKGFFLTNPETGRRYPTTGFMLFSCSFAEQRLEQFWARAGEFLPERWLAREGDPLHVRKNAFRSFELGPRNCIGQELAQLELKAILALTVRELDVESVFDDNTPEVLGEKGYQVMVPGQITGHPKGGMPVRVKFRDLRT